MARLCLCVSENPSTAVPYIFPNLISTCLSIAGSMLHFTPRTFLGRKSKPTLVKSPTFLNMHCASSLRLPTRSNCVNNPRRRNASTPKRYWCDLSTGLLNPINTEGDPAMHRCSLACSGNFKAVTVMHQGIRRAGGTALWI